MKIRPLVMSAVLFQAVWPLSAETIFFEDFDHYGYTPANFNPGVSVTEEPGSIKRLRISPKDKKYTVALKTPYLIPEAKRTENAEFSFIFRPLSNEIAKSYDVQLLFAPKPGAALKDLKTVTVKLNGDNGATLNGALGKSDIGTLHLNNQLASFDPLAAYQWYSVSVRMEDGAVSLTVDRGAPRVECRACLPEGYMLAGINFAGTFPFDVDEVKVVSLKKNPNPVKNTQVIPVDQEENRFSVSNIGYPGRIVLKFDDGSEKPLTATLNSFSQRAEWKVAKNVTEVKDGKAVTGRKIVNEPVLLEDSGLRFNCGGKGVSIYSIPLLYDRFESWQKRAIIKEALKAGETYSKRAGNREWAFRIVKTDKAAQLWIDGSYVMDLPLKNELKTVSVSVPQGAKTVLQKVVRKEPANPMIQTVDLPAGGFDTGVCRYFLGSADLEFDGYLSRSAFEAPPCAFLRRVPNAQYIKVHLICSLGENDPEKSTDVTARLTHYINCGRSPKTLADCTVTLPRTEKDPCPPNVKRYKDGKFEVTCDIPIGRIQDIIFMNKLDYLDFELLGGLWEKNIYYMSNEGKPAVQPSNVIVHSAVLEKTPVSMMVENGNCINMFYPDEEAFATAKLIALKPGKYAVNWIVKDIDGKIIDNTTDSIEFKAAGETKDVKKSFKQKENGHYLTEVRLLDGKNTLVTYSGSFSRIAADTRKAGYESPYGAWVWAGTHITSNDPKVYGEMLKRAGVRRVTGGWKSEAEVPKEYGPITGTHFSSLSAKGKTPEEREKSLETQIKDLTSRFPHVKSAMIFHESGGSALPLELIGGKTEVTENVKKRDESYAKRALELAHAWHKYAPDVKLVIGNSGVSLGLLAALFREKYPADMIDFTGDESVGCTTPPERSVAYPSWLQQELARSFGYKNIRPEACFEWKCHEERDFNSDRIAATFRVRDMLVAHAWKYNLIMVDCTSEVGNNYYNTIWGGGVWTRHPLHQPYPAATAVCVATQVLDCVKPQRLVPTGSTTVYVLEFKRKNEFVYACWTARGEVKTKVDFGGAKVTLTGFYGKTEDLKSDEITLTIEPCYLVSNKQINSASAAMERTYPWEEYGMKDAKVACAMDKIDGWKLVQGEDKRIIAPDDEFYNGTYRPGKFNFTQVKDDKKGDCLQVELVKEGECPAVVREYGFIRMDKPAPVEGTPSTLGVWVKGNSSWGKLFYEIEDADGEVWISAGTGGYGCVSYDWEEQMGINFDGWHFVQFPLTGASPVKIHSPGDNQWQWQGERTGDGQITFPIKVRGIGFALARKTLNLTDMVDVKDLSIRFKDFSAY